MITAVVFAEHLHKLEGGENVGGAGGLEDTVDRRKYCEQNNSLILLFARLSLTVCCLIV